MRKTLTIEPDVAQRLKKKMEQKNLGLKEAISQTLRAGLDVPDVHLPKRFIVVPHALGLKAGIDPDKMNQLVDDLEVEEFVKKYRG